MSYNLLTNFRQILIFNVGIKFLAVKNFMYLVLNFYLAVHESLAAKKFLYLVLVFCLSVHKSLATKKNSDLSFGANSYLDIATSSLS